LAAQDSSAEPPVALLPLSTPLSAGAGEGLNAAVLGGSLGAVALAVIAIIVVVIVGLLRLRAQKSPKSKDETEMPSFTDNDPILLTYANNMDLEDASSESDFVAAIGPEYE
jgi:hypothetical protein